MSSFETIGEIIVRNPISIYGRQFMRHMEIKIALDY